jgi:hypothetical protein
MIEYSIKNVFFYFLLTFYERLPKSRNEFRLLGRHKKYQEFLNIKYNNSTVGVLNLSVYRVRSVVVEFIFNFIFLYEITSFSSSLQVGETYNSASLDVGGSFQ